MSEEERRKLIVQQRNALYGEGSVADTGSFIDTPSGPSSLRGHSPLAYEYGRAPPVHPEGGPHPTGEGGQGSQSAGPTERSRANSNSSPQSTGGKGVFDVPAGQQPNRTSASSPGGGSPINKPGQGSVAPIGTRPSVSNASANPALNKQRSTTPLPSPLSQGYTASGNNENNSPNTTEAPTSTTPATEGPALGRSGWGSRTNGWGNKSGLGVQASVWG